ncbi:hypothetical protein RKLH11_1866 [Rhodobacteraceae bacterium KLH11]|nr:hypothetical protein RKLH11_1866 [Rhodobacteraceae bacterium KLH11]
MIWKTKTHMFTATVCQHTGKPCPALAQMARALIQTMSMAAPATTREFEIEGSGELSHCSQGCTARFRACPDQIRVFCDIDPNARSDQLDDYADLMFGTKFSCIPAGTLKSTPCAMLQAATLAVPDAVEKTVPQLCA